MNVSKHYGPGPHKSGTPQSTHGTKGGKGLTRQMMSQEPGQRGYSYDRKNNRFASKGFALSVFPEYEVVVPADEHLKEAIDAQADPEKMPGHFLTPHRSPGAPCPKCEGKVRKKKIAGRSSYSCPACQKK